MSEHGTVEREVKLSAWPGFRLPDLDSVAEGAKTRRLETIDLDATYYDTPDLRLGRRGITLRNRRRGVRETWTLKLPVGVEGDTDGGNLLARREIDIAGPPGDIPEALTLLVAADVRTSRLRPVARLVTLRRRTQVLGGDGAPLAEVDDDEVSIMDGGRVAARFRELEVEVAPDASDEVARRVVARLMEAGASPAEAAPKLAQALGPRFAADPEAAPVVLPAEPTAGQVVGAALRDAATRLIEHHVVAIQGVDPEGVHQMRVGARRLRSDLRTFRPLLDRAVTDPLRDELRWLGEVLGAVRDPDVLGERLRELADEVLSADDETAFRAVVGHLTDQRDQAVEAMREALADPRYHRLIDRVVSVAEDPPLRGRHDEPAADVLPGLVSKPWKQLKAQVDGLGEEPADTALHEVRKQAKQVRYAVEAVTPAVGRPARKAARAVKAVQEVLGDHQDTVVAEDWLRQGLDDPAEAFVRGALVAAERVRREDLRRTWRGSWERTVGGGRWAWLG